MEFQQRELSKNLVSVGNRKERTIGCIHTGKPMIQNYTEIQSKNKFTLHLVYKASFG